MAERNVKIELSIAGRSYKMTVDVAKEESYREAANRLNAKVAEYSKVAAFDLQDRLAMVALLYAITSMNLDRGSSLGNDDVERLHAIEKRIQNFIKQ